MRLLFSLESTRLWPAFCRRPQLKRSPLGSNGGTDTFTFLAGKPSLGSQLQSKLLYHNILHAAPTIIQGGLNFVLR